MRISSKMRYFLCDQRRASRGQQTKLSSPSPSAEGEEIQGVGLCSVEHLGIRGSSRHLIPNGSYAVHNKHSCFNRAECDLSSKCLPWARMFHCITLMELLLGATSLSPQWMKFLWKRGGLSLRASSHSWSRFKGSVWP